MYQSKARQAGPPVQQVLDVPPMIHTCIAHNAKLQHMSIGKLFHMCTLDSDTFADNTSRVPAQSSKALSLVNPLF
jgi:hypothetical protein